MRLLILTQKVDVTDAALGFFHGWIEEFAKNFEHIEVVCLQKGVANLPTNVLVRSLGKEDGESQVKYIRRFYQYIFAGRKNYDAVFVHMNQEYVLLGGLFWRLWGKRIIFWYNHTRGSILTKIAILLSHVVCHTSPFAFTAGRKKSRRMPAGINTEIFHPDEKVLRNPQKIMYIGRLAPAKKVHVLIEAVEILHKQNIDFTLNIYGGALEKDEEYLRKLREMPFGLRDKKVFFHDEVPNILTPKIFNTHLIAVNLTAKGNYDKTVLEAAACGALPLVSSEAFSDIIPSELYFKEDDAESLAEKIKWVIAMTEGHREELRKNLRMAVENNHSLKKLAQKIAEIAK